MIQNIYSVRDVKTSFAPPFTEYTDESAIRALHFTLCNQKNLFTFATEDFRLYCLGSMNTQTGEITPCTPRFVCDCITIAGLAPQDLKSDDRMEINYEK